MRNDTGLDSIGSVWIKVTLSSSRAIQAVRSTETQRKGNDQREEYLNKFPGKKRHKFEYHEEREPREVGGTF